jgi:hypothetical protein
MSILGMQPRCVVPKVRVLGPGGERMPDNTVWVCVSRHGPLRHPLTCPHCGSEVAKTGDFTGVRVCSQGEYVVCHSCMSCCLASPDDDVDPIRPGRKYDQAQYHAFARAERLVKRQRVTADVPKEGDWVVVIEQFDLTLPNGRTTPLKGCEARVETVSGDEAVVALNGDHGLVSTIGGSRATIPLRVIAPMVMSSLLPGDLVRFKYGPQIGMEATFRQSERGNVTVSLSGGEELTVPIERIEKVISNERQWA